jgi:hypothetical protein
MPAPLAFAFLDQLKLVVVALGPAGVHAQQHRRPVLAFGAAGPGMDFQIAVIAVGLAGQHGFQPHLLGAFGQRQNGILRIRHHAGIVLGLSHFDELGSVMEFIGQPGDRAQRAVQLLRSRISFCAAAGSFQRRGVFSLGVQFVQAAVGLIPVKDASSAGQWPAGCHRQRGRFGTHKQRYRRIGREVKPNKGRLYLR